MSVSPVAQTVSVGASFTVEISISGLDAGVAPSLGVFDLDFGFDAARVAFQSANFGPGLDVLGLGSLQVVTPGAGTVNLFELSLDSITDLNDLQPDGFLLGSLTFQAIGVGDVPFTLTGNSFGDAEGNVLAVAFGPSGSATVVGSVPEPGTFALLVWGVIGIAIGAARRERG